MLEELSTLQKKMHSTSIFSRLTNDFSKNKIFLKFNNNVNKIIT